MQISTLVRHARLALRSEAAIAEIKLRTAARKAALMGFAAIALLMALAFVNMALYAWLAALWGPVWAPLAIGLANVLLALAAFAAAAAAKPGPELEMAEEMRKLTAEALEDDLRGGVPGLLSGGGDFATARLLVPAVTAIVGALRRKTAEKG